MRFEDGRYLKDNGTNTIWHKSDYDYWTKLDSKWIKELDERLDTEFLTSNINEARLFLSEKACQSSNAYSWGARPVEVSVTINVVD